MEPVGGLRLAETFPPGALQHRGDRLRAGKTAELPGIHHGAVTGERVFRSVGNRRPGGFVGRDHRADLDPVFPGEGVVAPVVRRHGHHRAGAVVHEHIVGDEQRDVFAGERVPRGEPGGRAGLPRFRAGPFGMPPRVGRPRLRLFEVRGDRGVVPGDVQ